MATRTEDTMTRKKSRARPSDRTLLAQLSAEAARLYQENAHLRGQLAERDAMITRRDDVIRAIDDPVPNGAVTTFKNARGDPYRVLTPHGSYYRAQDINALLNALDELSAINAQLITVALVPPKRALVALAALDGELMAAWKRYCVAVLAVGGTPDTNVYDYAVALEQAITKARETGDLDAYREFVRTITEAAHVPWLGQAFDATAQGAPQNDAIRWAGEQVARLVDNGLLLKECIPKLKERMDAPGFDWEWRDYLKRKLEGRDAVKHLSHWRRMWLSEQ